MLILKKNEAPSCHVIMSCVSRSVVSNSLRACQAPLPWDSPGKSTGVGCHFRLQRIFPTQGSNMGLKECKVFLKTLIYLFSIEYVQINYSLVTES